MNTHKMIPYSVRFELYEAQGATGRVLVQEWEETKWLPDFYAVGHVDYVNGNPLHRWIVEERFDN